MISSFTALYSFSYLFVLQKVSFFCFVWMPLSFRAHFLTTQPTTGNGQALTKAEAMANTYILSNPPERAEPNESKDYGRV